MDEDTLKAALRAHTVLRSRGLRLALAESCTGGYISHLLTDEAGASDFLAGDIVAYSREAKVELLGVQDRILESFGAISGECALAMAQGAMRALGAHIALAVTGVLGPGTVEGAPVGLVYASVATASREETRDFRFSGKRAEIKEAAAMAALELLCEAAEWA